MGIPAYFISIIIFLVKVLKYGAKVLYYFGTNAESHLVQFCNFVQFHSLANAITALLAEISSENRRICSFHNFLFITVGIQGIDNRSQWSSNYYACY
jgi:hypothetical protein